ncbi:MAG: hypothetical protein E7261_04085 [Lachnospiraceae bacterium]|nr:hypothetical protein [Lachnospiraceae bacterium]
MRKEDFCDVLADINENYVKEARMPMVKSKKNTWVKWVAIAAVCLCIVSAIGITYIVTSDKEENNNVLKWSEGFVAEDYFKYNKYEVSSTGPAVDGSVIAPYAETRYFSDYRTEFEMNGVIPTLSDYPEYEFTAQYNEDGSIYSVRFFWAQRSENYNSYMELTAGYQEEKIIRDCIDAKAGPDNPYVTVTERAGIQIVARRYRGGIKTLTFQDGEIWYQIKFGWKCTYDDAVRILDWIWEHPIDFNLFTIDRGTEITRSNLEEMPEAFSEYIPDFSELFDYVCADNFINLKDGEPYEFQGSFFSDVKVLGEYDTSTRISWYIYAQPDYYVLQRCMGDISEITEQLVTDIFSEISDFTYTDGEIIFMKDNYLIWVSGKDADIVWHAIESLKND